MAKKKNIDRNNYKDKYIRNVSVLRFILTYVLLMEAFFLLLSLKPVKEIIDINGTYSSSIVYVTSKFLGLLGVVATYSGSIYYTA